MCVCVSVYGLCTFVSVGCISYLFMSQANATRRRYAIHTQSYTRYIHMYILTYITPQNICTYEIAILFLRFDLYIGFNDTQKKKRKIMAP